MGTASPPALGLPQGRGALEAPARPPTDSGEERGVGGGAPVGGDEADRPQDRENGGTPS